MNSGVNLRRAASTPAREILFSVFSSSPSVLRSRSTSDAWNPSVARSSVPFSSA